MTGMAAHRREVAAAPRIAYQGEPGAYSERSIHETWEGRAAAVGVPTFAEALALLGRGEVDYAMIPVWNSTVGTLPDTRLLLDHHAGRITIVSERTMPIVHCLLALPGASSATLRHVGSHATALAQCRRLFARRVGALQPCVAHDTAGAARELVALGGGSAPWSSRAGMPAWFEPYLPADRRSFGVIAGAGVALQYGLTMVEEAVQDEPDNATRFAVVQARDGVRW